MAALAVTLVLLGFVLNIVAGKTSTTTDTSADADPVARAPRPVAPLYVPRPASLIIAMYGGSLSADASPQDVAKAFALSYYQYDPAKSTPETFADALPRLGAEARQRLPEQLPKHWEGFLSKVSRAGTPQVTVRDAESPKGGSGRAAVTVVIVDTPAQGQESGAPKPAGGSLRMDIDLEKREKDGWTVTSVNLAQG
ncbi:hypothetical protein ACH4XT_17115 [Streptomyces avidinii]|uniref:hypothetical protein n=1 Tax=Streptomyces avidinii TaxID=1895 RepID=UPI0037B77DFA